MSSIDVVQPEVSESNLPWVEEHGFRFVQPSEALKQGFKVGFTELGKGMDLMRFVDLDGSGVLIPRLYQDPEIRSVLSSIGVSEDVSLDDGVRTAVLANLENGQSSLLAVAGSEGMANLVNTKKEPHIVMGIYGERGSGKSMMTAALALKYDFPIETIDVFSLVGPKEYLRAFKEAGLTANSDGSEIVQVVDEFRQASKSMPSGVRQAPTLRGTLRKICADASGSKSKLLLLENVSAPNSKLEINAFHLVRDSSESSLAIITGNNTEQDRLLKSGPVLRRMGNALILSTPYSSNRSETKITGSVLDEVLGRFEELRPEIVERGLRRRQEFYDAMKSTV